MAKPQVTLTLAGDDASLSRTFDQVGAASKRMADDVGGSSKRVADETTESFGRTNAAAENTYSKFDALESVGRGTADTMTGVGEIMSGNVLQGATDLAGGIAALADGFVGALLPALRGMSKASLTAAASTVRQTTVTVASRAASLAASAASKAWAATQWLLNAALSANPIGLVVIGIAALVAGFIIAYKKSETFRTIVNGALGGVKVAFTALVKAGQGLYTWFSTNIPKIGGFFSSVASAIAAPFRAAFDGIRGAWNSTIGGKGFSFPGIAGHGAFSFHIPTFHTGGIVPGALGSETMAVLRAGEQVTSGSNSGGGTIVFGSDGTRAGDLLYGLFKETMRVRDPQAFRVVFVR